MIRRLIFLAHISTVFFYFTACAAETNKYASPSPDSDSGQAPPVVKKRILCEGDSRTDGGGSPGSKVDLSSYPARLAILLHANYYKNGGDAVIFDAANQVEVVNIGLGGDTAQRILANETGQVDAYILPGGETIYILDAGGNDIVAGRPAAQVSADIRKIQDKIAAKGLKVYTATIGNAGITQANRNKVIAVNKSISAGKTGGKTIDYWSVPKLVDFTDSNYFQTDQIHYTPEGNQVKAETAFAVLSGSK